MKKALLLTLLLLGHAFPLPAQSFFTPAPQYLTPSFRNGANTEYSRWDVFYSPYAGANYPDIKAPNGTDGYFSESGLPPSVLPPNANPSDPWAFWNTSNPTLTQTNNAGQFLTSPGIAGNIYSFSGANAFEIADATAYSLGTVMVQWQTDGTLIDLSTLKLVYNNGGGDIELSATNLITEYKSSGSSFGGLTNRTAAQWNLAGLGITSYKIVFASAGSSNSFQELLLDTSASYSEAVPSARTWDGGGGTSLWSNAANWSGDSMTVTGGNVRFSSGGGVVLDSNRTIGELALDGPSGFVLGNSGGAVLKINTGITATPASAATYTVSAPVALGAFNLINLNGNTDLTLSGVISGSTGYTKQGDGTLRLTGNNTFTGSVDIEGGTAIVSGTNAYTGTTSVASGTLVLKGNAPSGAPGTLGSATSNVAVGLDPATYGAKAEAALIVEGDYTVGRGIDLATGGNPKALGERRDRVRGDQCPPPRRERVGQGHLLRRDHRRRHQPVAHQGRPRHRRLLGRKQDLRQRHHRFRRHPRHRHRHRPHRERRHDGRVQRPPHGQRHARRLGRAQPQRRHARRLRHHQPCVHGRRGRHPFARQQPRHPQHRLRDLGPGWHAPLGDERRRCGPGDRLGLRQHHRHAQHHRHPGKHVLPPDHLAHPA